MKKLICLFSVSLLFLTSCTNDTESNEVAILPTKRTIIHPLDSPAQSVLVFNGSKIVSETYQNNFKELYTYAGDFITKIESIDDKGVVNLTKEYNYVDGRLSSSQRKISGRDYYEKYRYTYNTDGTISFSISNVAIANGAEEVASAVNKYTLKDGNIVKYEYVSTSGDTYVTLYEYDAKNSPMRNVLGFNKILEEQPQISSSLNNVIKYTVSSTNKNLTTYTNEIKYTYGANDFPTEIKYYYGESVAFTFSYSY